jgi:mono/diheme cytochrome c family protein
MKLVIERKGIILATVAGLTAIGLALAAGKSTRPRQDVASSKTAGSVIPIDSSESRRGYELFQLNCAHCHARDARGDEGPDLHGVTKSDARISSLIKNGIKGEMPKFAEKLTDNDVQALIAFLRSLSDA